MLYTLGFFILIKDIMRHHIFSITVQYFQLFSLLVFGVVRTDYKAVEILAMFTVLCLKYRVNFSVFCNHAPVVKMKQIKHSRQKL